MEGQLTRNPLPELICEIRGAGLSGALRLTRERLKVAVYFDGGTLIFASSNLRAHRLAEYLRRNAVPASTQLTEFPKTVADDEMAAMLIQRGILTSDSLNKIRGNQVSEILRLALLWTTGSWSFDSRARLAADLRVELDVNRLLLECARHLPASFLRSRFADLEGTFCRADSNRKGNLLREEVFVLSRATAPVTLAELEAVSGLNEEQTLRSVYGLSLTGYLLHSKPRRALSATMSAPAGRHDGSRSSKHPATTVRAAVSTATEDLKTFFSRLEHAKDHYDVLDVGRSASSEEIKTAYHTLARTYHPDRFHQSDPKLRARVDSAFARIAQAYEALSDQTLRAAYDARSLRPKGYSKNSAPSVSTASNVNNAESSFQRGKAALQQNRRAEALRFLGEAALRAPREARYRAEYGQALIGEASSRRLAEAELQAAIALDPNNSSYRVMLAELYQQHGLRRRAIGELERALALDPKNEAARSLLSKLKGSA